MTFNVFRGHFLTREEVAKLMGCTSTDVPNRPELLAVHGAVPGNESYPAVQFDADGRPTEAVRLLVEKLSPYLDDAEIASFCTLPMTQLGGQTPIDYLRQGGTVERACRAALAA
jgi:hypothetical protein